MFKLSRRPITLMILTLSATSACSRPHQAAMGEKEYPPVFKQATFLEGRPARAELSAEPVKDGEKIKFEIRCGNAKEWSYGSSVDELKLHGALWNKCKEDGTKIELTAAEAEGLKIWFRNSSHEYFASPLALSGEVPNRESRALAATAKQQH